MTRPDPPSDVTALVGRQPELAAIEGALALGARLVTLLGPPGVGKSRLARHIGRAWRDAGGGVVWLDVSSAETIPGVDDVVDALAGRAGPLVVFDNAETAVAAVSELAGALLAELPDLQILAAARCALAIDGETRLHLEPLPHDDAIALFVDRVRTRRAGWAPGAGELATIAAVVRRLDALPLAIELAAAWMDVLSSAELLSRLDRRFEILRADRRDRPERHGSLEAALESSWQLLEPEEREALAAVSIFRGGFDGIAAEAVLAPCPGQAVVVRLRALRDASLLRVVDGAQGAVVRYTLCDSIAEFARAKLDASGQRGDLERRHAAHYAALSTTDRRRLVCEADNIAAAIRAIVDRDVDTAVALAIALVATELCPADRCGPLIDAVRVAAADRGNRRALAAALIQRAVIDVRALHWDQAARHASQARAIARQLGLRQVEADATRWLGRARWGVGAWEDAAGLFEEALAIHRELGDRRAAADMLRGLGMVRWAMGQADEAVRDVEGALELFRDEGDSLLRAACLNSLAALRLDAGEPALALELADAALEAVAGASADAELYALWTRGLSLLALGRSSEARHELDLALARSDTRDHPMRQAEISILLAVAWLTIGDLDQAHRVIRPILATRRLTWRGWLLCWAAAIAAERGNVAEARRLLAEADRAPLPPVRPPFPALVELAARFVELADARLAGRAVPAALAQFGGAGSVPGPVAVVLHALQAAVDRAASGAATAAPGADRFRIAKNGRWFTLPSGAHTDLARRGSLRRVLWRLAEQRLAAPGVGLSNDDLVAAGWPGQRLLTQAGTMRVYVAVSSLRRLGLRDVLFTQDDGYLLDPRLPIDVVTDVDG